MTDDIDFMNREYKILSQKEENPEQNVENYFMFFKSNDKSAKLDKKQIENEVD